MWGQFILWPPLTEAFSRLLSSFIEFDRLKTLSIGFSKAVLMIVGFHIVLYFSIRKSNHTISLSSNPRDMKHICRQPRQCAYPVLVTEEQAYSNETQPLCLALLRFWALVMVVLRTCTNNLYVLLLAPTTKPNRLRCTRLHTVCHIYKSRG